MSRPDLRVVALRARIIAALRRALDDRGFLEVETPGLVPAPGQDPHLRCFTVQDAEGRPRGYLRTSPEHAAKRLLARGLSRIYELGKVFRDEPPSNQHQPEFTMLEFYRAQATTDQTKDDCADLVRAAGAVVAPDLEFRRAGQTLDLRRRPVSITISEITEADLALDWRAHPDAGDLLAAAEAGGLRFGQGPWSWDAVFTKLVLEVVEPALPRDRIVFLEGFPASQASYARLAPADPTEADRFEMYIAGVELANAFGELTDPAEQRRRFEVWREERRQDGGPDYPLDEPFLAELADMPDAAGVALGVDRLVQVLLDAGALDEVMLFPDRLPAAGDD